MSNITVNKVEEDKKIFKAVVHSTFTKHRQYRFLGGLRHSFSFPIKYAVKFGYKFLTTFRQSVIWCLCSDSGLMRKLCDICHVMVSEGQEDSMESAPEELHTATVDIKKFALFLHGEQGGPTKVICSKYNTVLFGFHNSPFFCSHFSFYFSFLFSSLFSLTLFIQNCS